MAKTRNSRPNKKSKSPEKAILDALIKQLKQERNTIQEMESHTTPAKKYTKLPSSKVTPNSFNQNLRGVPGGPMNTYGRVAMAMLRMIDAEDTGTMIAGPSIRARLKYSGQHCNTTASNYLV